MSQSNITVHIVNFRPHYKGGCLAELKLDNSAAGAPGTPPTDHHVELPTSYKIKLRPALDPNDPHCVVFSIKAHDDGAVKGQNYFLVGVYFVNRKLFGSADQVARNVGRHFIRGVACDLNATPPTLTLTIDRKAASAAALKAEVDAKRDAKNLEFMLLVQEESTGEFGIIDPEWENE